jgi:hypothetical protein
LSLPPPQGLFGTTPIKQTEARPAPSLVVLATTVAGSAHADRANDDQCSALTCRVRHHSDSLSPQRHSEQRPEQRLTCRARHQSGWLSHAYQANTDQQRSHLSSPPPQWLAEPTSTEGTEARAAPSTVVPATTVPDWYRADQATRGQTCALTCLAGHHSGRLTSRRRIEDRPDERPHTSCKPPWWLAGPTPTKQTVVKVAPSTVVPSPQGLAEPTPSERTEAREAPSHVPVTTMTDWVHAYQANRGHSSDVTCRPHIPSVCLSLRRPREQKLEQRPQISCPPPQWLSEHADRGNRGQSSALTCRARHHSGSLGPRRPREQRSEQRPHLSYPPPQWLAEPTPTERAEAREAPSHVVPATTMAGWVHADQSNRGQTSAFTCRACHHIGWLSPRRPREQRSEQRPHLSYPPPQRLAEPTPTERAEAREAPSHVVPATTVAG